MTAVQKQNPFLEFLDLYKNDIPRFVREVLGLEPDPWQVQVMQWRQEGERRISVRSGHGVGKSSLASWLMLHHILCYLPQKTVVTAPTSSQLYDALFSELKAGIQRLPQTLQQLLDVKADRVTLIAAPDDSFISARTSRAETPESLQGIHSAHVLLIADEASGIPESVFEAAAGSMSGENACTILLGNPTRGSGFFFNTHHGNSGDWNTLRVSCDDSPRVSKEYIGEMGRRYGEESSAYRVRVLGEFPLADVDTVIPLELVEAAINRDVEVNPMAPTLWGIDVARFGSDRSALAKRKANKLLEPVRTFKGLDLMQLVGVIKAEYESLTPSERPIELLVDSIGLGAGVVDRLRELGLPVRGINVSESPSMGETYLNLRAELWFKMKAWLAARDCFLPQDDQLRADLTIPKFKFTSSGKMQLESKDEIRRRGLQSPDAGDAFALTFASDAATALHGRTNYSWKKAIKRGLRLV